MLRAATLLVFLILLIDHSTTTSTAEALTIPYTMLDKPSRAKRSRSKQRKKAENDVAIVGPDYVQLLTGRLFHKDVALVLYGESHQDAIDVTRKGGVFIPKEGWISQAGGSSGVLQKDINEDNVDDVLRVIAKTKKSLPLGKCKDWAKDFLEDNEVLEKTSLVWIQDLPEARVTKGKAFVLESSTAEELDEDEWKEGWFSHNSTGDDSIPAAIGEWMRLSQSDKEYGRYKTFEWGDLDSEAFELNKRRMTEEEISEQELDSIVNKRKIERRKENLWTWDDWFSDVRAQALVSDIDVDLHLVLESSIPPWELDLHRPGSDQDVEKLKLPPAADCIRCVAEDEEESIEDELDPSSDGVGSYIDFVYRRFMGEMIAEQGKDQSNPSSTWLHCVDARDLGCQAACHADSVKTKWNNLLLEDEIDTLLNKEGDRTSLLPLQVDSTGRYIKFVPETRMNPERFECDEMKRLGLILEDDDKEEEEEEEEEDQDEFTYPSFEGFFGQNADFLYYDLHVKVNYSPFLARCVGSLTKWEAFFTELFFGGTIPGALTNIDLNSQRDHLYVRSPIQKTWNPEAAAYEYGHRDDGEHYITQPFFPYLFCLTAKNTGASRTWSSELFATLCNQSYDSGLSNGISTGSPKDVATAARDWVLERIKQHAEDPKGSDDPLCGGEWFEAYLKAAHREIYDDIDTLDSTLLLRKSYMKSESSGRKHNIGKIKVPSCKDAFTEITQHFKKDLPSQDIVSPQIEVLAKIIIDIWISSLVDFASILKIADVISRSKSDKVVIVCYMGSAHTRAVADFYVNRMNFKQKTLIGKFDWENDAEPHTLGLPSYMWNISGIFDRTP
jgi:hypothetical protein